MKTLIIALFTTLAFTAGAQTNIQTINISTNTTGGDTGDVAGTKINNNFSYVAALISSNTAAIALTSQTLSNYMGTNSAGGGTVGTNVVQITTQTTALSTNINFTGSNVIGTFTNVIQIIDQSLVNGTGSGPTPGATATLTNLMSLDGGVTWVPFYATNAVVQIAILCDPSMAGFGPLVIYTCNQPQLIGNSVTLYGQTLSVPDPSQAQNVATKNYVDKTFGQIFGHTLQMAPDWNIFGTLTPSNSSVVFNINSAYSNTLSLTWSFAYAPMHSIALDGTGTNILLSFTNNLAGWQIYTTTNLLNLVWLPLATNSLTLSTNSGLITAQFPMPNPVLSFFRLVIPGAVTIAAAVPVQMPQLYLPSYTVSHSTNSTFGYGAGLLAADTNYLYGSVATNSWRRVAWPTNSW